MSSPRYVDRATPTWVRAMLAVQLCCGALYGVLVVGGAEALGLPLDPTSWWPIGVLNLVAAVSCIARALHGGRERLPWGLLGLGIASSGLAFILWAAVYEQQASPPYPSLADALWLPYYLFLLAAIAALIKSERPRIPATTWLDALIPACAVSAVASQLLLPHVSTAGQPLAAQITLLAYPALDVLLVVVAVVFLALRGWEPDTRWGLLALAVLGSALGDTLWSYLVAAGSYQSGSAADLPYVVCASALALAAWAPRTTDAARAGDDRLTLLLPGVAAIGALGLLLYGGITGDLIHVSLALAVAAVGAGVARWLVAVRREAQASVLRDVADELSRKADQQAAVADLGRQAIASGGEECLMQRAAETVAAILGADRVAVLELEDGGRDLVVRADCVAKPGGRELEPIGLAALGAGRPAVVMRKALTAPIEGRDGPWGVITVLQENGELGDDDVSFVQGVANVLGAVVARAREEQLEAQLQQSRRLESVGKLAGGVAHDFNNLLAVILNYADFALEAATDEGQRRDLEELSKAATRGAELVRQLLAFSRRRPVDAVALDLAEVVRDMEPMLRRTIGEHIDLRCWVASELAPTVIDPGQVTQLLMNLTVNARDAMPDGGQLTIQATEIENGVRLVVGDTGLGMSEETVAKAFDPFFTTKPPGSGTGLGLATVYGIVSQAGGTVSIDSQLGRGTRVTIDLPTREPLYPPAQPRREEPVASEQPSGTVG
ncbi:MAG TPA: ATP-binding protein [Thermoleophilaceae bacterium]|nr:ATP-binding protein [Thermoleophilaceae bacterium]